MNQSLKTYTKTPKQLLLDVGKVVHPPIERASDSIPDLRALVYFVIKDQIENGRSMSDSLVAVRHGFKPEYYYLLGLDSPDRDPKKYVSRMRLKYIGTEDSGPFARVNKNSRWVLQDKFAIYSIFEGIDDYFPEIYGMIHDGRYYSYDDGKTNSLIEAVETYDTVVGKPVDKEQGKGFRKIDSEDGFSINGERATQRDLEELERDPGHSNQMVTEYIQQHEYSDRIMPDTTNTIRVLTVRDPDTGEYHVIRPAHRFGTEKSKPVDNFDNGGVVSSIDVESGELGPITVLDENGKRHRQNDHPDTGAQIAGVTVPNWDLVKEIILEGAQSYPLARIIGWDIIITPDDPVILEASGHPSEVIPQFEQGLLENPIARRALNEAE